MTHPGRRKSYSKALAVLTLVLVAHFFLQPNVIAQSDSGRIVGIVHDQNKAVVPGAKVTIKNERTGEERTADTDEQGYYVITNLKPSVYTIRVVASGIGQSEMTGLQLLVGQALVSDLEVKPAGTSETVSVVAGEGAGTSRSMVSAKSSAKPLMAPELVMMPAPPVGGVARASRSAASISSSMVSTSTTAAWRNSAVITA